MRICIDARSLSQKGIYSYGTSLLRSFIKIDSINEYIILVDRNQSDYGFESLKKIIIPSANPLNWIIWSNTVLPKILDTKDVDIYHSFKHVTAYNLKAKKVLTFHGGPMLYRFPEFYKWYDRIYWKLSYRMAIKKYDRIIATADAEKDFFVKNLGAPESKFRVVNLACDERFKLIQNKDDLQHVKEKFGLQDPFILFLGRIHPQKNIERLVKAYKKAKGSFNRMHKLVIVGGKSGSYFQRVFNLVQDLHIAEDVMFLGHIPSDDVPYVYNLADLFLFPTNYENWGIVLLEAMACGLPVITSNISDIDEVVEESAIRVDPNNISEIAEAIVKVINSENIRQSLIQKGLQRVQAFSWDRCAGETIKVYEALLES